VTRIRSKLGPTTAVALGTGLVTSLGGGAFEIAALVKGEGEGVIALHVLAFLLMAVGAALVAMGLVMLARLVKYGEAWLEVGRERGDGALRGVVEATLEPSARATAVLTFVCRRVTHFKSAGHSGSGGSITKVLHQARVEIPRSAMSFENGRVRIPFHLELPRELPEPGMGTNQYKNWFDLRWDLTCHVDAPGLALRVPFELMNPPASSI